jgi:hypothetical protein
MKKRDTIVFINGVKTTLCEYRKPKKESKTWSTATGHIYAYVGIGGRGAAKGKSTMTFTL